MDFGARPMPEKRYSSYTDAKTGIPVISLYGSKRKPSAEDLADVDILLFDIQDVGVRFYTFISSLQDFMECLLKTTNRSLFLIAQIPMGFMWMGPY